MAPITGFDGTTGPSFRMTRLHKVNLALLVLAGLATVLAACISGPARVCPTPYILDQTGSLVRFAPGASLADANLDFRATMEIKSVRCKFRDELLTDLEVNMDIELIAIRGAGNTSGEASFEYFVAITDVRGNILNKEVFDVEMDLGAVGRPAVKTESIWQRYALLRGQSAQAYRVWYGFQLTDRDVEVMRQLSER